MSQNAEKLWTMMELEDYSAEVCNEQLNLNY